jgi:hypothetical protein
MPPDTDPAQFDAHVPNSPAGPGFIPLDGRRLDRSIG